jgi:hypothetical protein
VGWNNDTREGEPLDITFEFDSIREFGAVHLHANNMFARGVQVSMSRVLLPFTTSLLAVKFNFRTGCVDHRSGCGCLVAVTAKLWHHPRTDAIEFPTERDQFLQEKKSPTFRTLPLEPSQNAKPVKYIAAKYLPGASTISYLANGERESV